MFALEDIYFLFLFLFFSKKKKRRLTLTLIEVQVRPQVILTQIWFRICCLMYKTLSLQPSVVDYKKIYSLRPIFWLESKLTLAKKTKQNKTKQKQRSTDVKLLVAESAVKWNVPEESRPFYILFRWSKSPGKWCLVVLLWEQIVGQSSLSQQFNLSSCRTRRYDCGI